MDMVELSRLILKQIRTCPEIGFLIANYVGDQNLALCIDDCRVRQVYGSKLTCERFQEIYKIDDMKSFLHSICSNLNLHPNVVSIFNQENWLADRI